MGGGPVGPAGILFFFSQIKKNTLFLIFGGGSATPLRINKNPGFFYFQRGVDDPPPNIKKPVFFIREKKKSMPAGPPGPPGQSLAWSLAWSWRSKSGRQCRFGPKTPKMVRIGSRIDRLG